MTKRAIYSVAFNPGEPECMQSVRYFTTKRGAGHWFNWLLTQPYVTQVLLYRGRPGGEVLDGWHRRAA